MLRKVTLSDIKDYTKDKNGQPLIAKGGPNKGKPYTKRSIKCDEIPDKTLYGFKSKWNENWQIGEEVTVEVTEENGYLHFGFASTENRLVEMCNELNKRLGVVEKALADIQRGYKYPEQEAQPDFDVSEEGPADEWAGM